MSSSRSGKAKSWPNYVGLSILLVCYIGALMNVLSIKRAAQGADVIRMCHWQLELGVRDALADMIDRFEAYKAEQGVKVKIVQIPIPERAYTQYVTTQLMGATAPDIIEVGFFDPVLLGRYFFPLSRIIQDANPFVQQRLDELNSKSSLTEDEAYFKEVYQDLSGSSWMDTYIDGLRSQYYEQYQEYFTVGLSQFTVRMFYNKDMFREILGREHPPQSFRDLMECCRRISAYGAEQGKSISPIASSKYQVDFFKERYMSTMVSDKTIELDNNYDGWLSVTEKIQALLTGKFSAHEDNFEAGSKVMRSLAQHFPPGFMSLDRMDAGFQFVQGEAAMITSGSWDAKSFLKKIADQPEDRSFEVGIFDFPMVGHDDPEFGEYFDGRVSEATTGTGFPWGITRFTKYFDLCIEFLQFCSLPENNEILNEIAGWIPAVRGARPSEELKPFEPNYVGLWGGLDFKLGPRSETAERQVYWQYIQGDLTFEEYADAVMEKVGPQAATDYARLYRSYDENLPDYQARRSAYLAALVFSPEEEKEQGELKVLRVWNRLSDLESGQDILNHRMKEIRAWLEEKNYSSDFNDKFFARLEKEVIE